MMNLRIGRNYNFHRRGKGRHLGALRGKLMEIVKAANNVRYAVFQTKDGRTFRTNLSLVEAS
jgi:hypothetical protein